MVYQEMVAVMQLQKCFMVALAQLSGFFCGTSVLFRQGQVKIFYLAV
jgi:hypothetical protein